MKNIIFIAPPAAGKGTVSARICEKYNIPHISTGDLLRDEISSGSQLGESLKQEMDQGNLISNEIIVNLLRNRISKVDCNNGYILDGYPRNVEQAKIYKDMLKELNKDYLTLLKSENEFLKEQLEEKDKQISELHKLIENSQILLKEEQKKSEQQLYLAEHFEEVDNKLQDLKEKMEQKRNEKIKIFKIFSK